MKDITYPYWLIYFIYENGENELYAYTDNKSFMKRFKEERDMKKFIVIKRELTREKIHRLTKDCKAMYLELFKAKTKVYDKTSYHIREVTLLITQQERLTISNVASDYIFSKLWVNLDYDPYVFKDKYLRALWFTDYVAAHEYIQCEENSFMYPLGDIIDCFEPDYIGIFLDLYSDTMKG